MYNNIERKHPIYNVYIYHLISEAGRVTYILLLFHIIRFIFVYIFIIDSITYLFD